MKIRRTINGVLHNFLESYTSRYSDYKGYWIFGFLVKDQKHLIVDLLRLQAASEMETAQEVAIKLAVAKFQEQLNKAGISHSWLREARLQITPLPAQTIGFVNGRRCPGFNVKFEAIVVYDTEKTYQREILVFVAPHDPTRESRSRRG